MKVYWVGVFDGVSWRAEYRIARALRRRGVQIVPVNFRSPTYVPAEHWTAHGDGCNVVLLQNARGFRADWLHIFDSAPVVYWATEASASKARHILDAEHRPNLIIANSAQTFAVAKKKGYQVVRMHNGYATDQYNAKPIHEQFDVAILGTMTKRRKQFVRRLKELIPGLRLCIRKRYTAEQANNIYNASKVVLHIHAIEETYLPSRLFEVMPTRGCLLVEDMGENWDKRIGSGGFRTFKGPQDMCNQIRYLLASDEQRIRMVQIANQEAKKHTWKARSAELLAHLRKVAA
jgi:hypothetical protein